jgi:hypothetical protein
VYRLGKSNSVTAIEAGGAAAVAGANTQQYLDYRFNNTTTGQNPAASVGINGVARSAQQDISFQAWKKQNNKVYATTEEEQRRYANWRATEQRIAAARSANPHATFSHNAFSDESEDEFKTKRFTPEINVDTLRQQTAAQVSENNRLRAQVAAVTQSGAGKTSSVSITPLPNSQSFTTVVTHPISNGSSTTTNGKSYISHPVNQTTTPIPKPMPTPTPPPPPAPRPAPPTVPPTGQGTSGITTSTGQGGSFTNSKCDNSSSSIPSSWDWSTCGWNAAVLDQGSCNSCWAFTSSEVASAKHYILTGEVVEMSPQQLVDCANQNNGCGDGWPMNGLNYIQNRGLESIASYPYVDASGVSRSTCKPNPSENVVKPNTFTNVQQENSLSSAKLKELIYLNGPVISVINANELTSNYSGGILSATSGCNSQVNHAVLITGWGTDPQAGEYWIVKNSWGVGWGDAGFFKVAMNVGGSAGWCNIQEMAFYAETPKN